MYPFSPWRLARGLKGRLLQSGSQKLIERLSSDSRKIENGSAYIALPGERFDGEAFYGQARKAGASALIGPNAPKWPGITSIRVADSLGALQALARDQRALFQGPLVGITGSNGKTGAKECLSFLLGPEETLSSPGNWNNHIGLPLTLLGLQRKHRVAVLEMGMNHPGN